MKETQTTDVAANLDSAFARINSANGEELNEIVDTIEKYGRKGKGKKKKVSLKKPQIEKSQLLAVH